MVHNVGPKNVYNLIRIAVGDKWNTAFLTKQGLLLHTVMALRLINATVSFQEMIVRMFKNIEECIWYLDHIVIYCSNTNTEHQAIVENVPQQCIEHQLAVNLLKSDFHNSETIFLRHVMNGQEVKMDISKLKTISKWPILTKKK